MAFVGDVVLLADELVVLENIKLLAGQQLFSAHHTREAVQVKHFVPCFPDQVTGRDALRAPVAFGTVPPATQIRKHPSITCNTNNTVLC